MKVKMAEMNKRILGEYDPHIPMPGELSAEELKKLEEGHEERMRIILENATANR